ncbi:MAG: hypothetical protein R8P61_03330 [Bacteroidia bacterium]|nr:hypothetical protein [Bacteroidia bacterium]
MENTIIVRGGAYREVKRALQAWINLYADNLLKDICFEMYRNGRGNHVIKADKRLRNQNFFFLVNYLTHPMNIEYKAQVTGYTRGDDQSDWTGQNLMVYISDTDKEGDNVFLLTEDNRTYKVPFGLGAEIEEVTDKRSYRSPQLSNLILPDILSIQSEEIRELERATPVEIGKRRLDIGMQICAFALSLAFLLAYLIPDPKLYEPIAVFLILGSVILFFIFHELLQHKEIYLRSLVFAGGVAAFSYFLHIWFRPKLSEFVFVWGTFPLLFLLIQWPLRRLYLLIFKKEPSLDKTGKLGDFLYSMLLYITLIWVLLLFGKLVT